ncbi:aromatic amino acid transaminase [Pandoraea apista]|uniref:Aromatic amino acid aminotransferase n=1 Tax=Pandoraea apista TaxID=93218 RepID=A0A0G4JDL8_9BURK|nr:amino acid aminotransferase [Pandoraea apista]ALS66478.1 aromatic amino acid aminotransferase [Pandoraea apista]AVF38622.1 aspartate/tyrosine/aromatic aminotransferase [Pandoraea apista]OXS94717.1 aromatic amino acid aminotransferase [Pandoraea apista]RRW94158.1 aspartate/tyrosine/aromatic aminotransferase [Pandoraea apista]RRW99175.1 aspartate/tyrosine/aromatic aminotransferase [Pandoraea apista]
MFSHVDAYPGDPILGLNEAFGRDPRQRKVNLSIGIYFDDDGRLPVMQAVRDAESAVLTDIGPRPYLPMAGTQTYRDAVQALVFGEANAARREQRIATLQTLGGGGALRVGADFLKRYFPESTVWISDPSWDNHRVVFESAGFPVQSYPYYDDATGGLRFDAMLETLSSLPPRSIVLLHACCHNPTGVDLTPAQWQTLIPVLHERGLIAFVDMAYQGFGDGLDADAFAVRALTDAGVPTVVANSFSKNFSLYGERCGALSVVCASADEASRVFGQLTGTVRANYSNPPTHGARLVAQVLTTPALRRAWEDELDGMRTRIATMRAQIHARLAAHVSAEKLSRYLAQRGMFTYTGLSAAQADALRETHGVYLLRSGRMCVAGLNTRNVDTVAHAIAQVLAQG